MIDYSSKYAFVIPIPDKKAETIVKALAPILKDPRKRPEKLQTDNGKEFSNQTLSEFLKTLVPEVEQKFGRPYTPEDQGVIEAFNRSVRKALKFILFGNEERKDTKA